MMMMCARSMRPTKSWAMCALALATLFSAVRSQCVDFDLFFGDVSSVSEIDVSEVVRVDCPSNDEGELLREVLIESGKTLAIKSTKGFTRFVNIRFTVEDGASLVFEMDLVVFGPNTGSIENPQGSMIDVKEGGSVTFLGDFIAKEVRNVRSVFTNAGTMDFKGTGVFKLNGSVFLSNSGDLKFRGKTSFTGNWGLAIENVDSGFVRFSVRSAFRRNAKLFDGGGGCAISNNSLQGRLTFRGDATFRENSCDGPGAISSSGDVKFYGKAIFHDNSSSGTNGGAVRNVMGSMTFKAAVQFVGNAAGSGGGLAVEGGDVTFDKFVTFDGNTARETGGAFSVTYGSIIEDGETTSGYGSLTFNKPEALKVQLNSVVPVEDTELSFPMCDFGYVEDGSTVVGFPGDGVCVEP